MKDSELLEQIEHNKDRLFDILSQLIKIDSQNFGSHGNEKNAAEFIYKTAKEMGFESDIYSPLDVEGLLESGDYFPGRNLENRLNASFMIKGKENVNGLLFMGHNDTVPIGDAKSWNVDPLGGIIKNGKVYGRGACDDKYAIAACLYLFEILKNNGFKPKKNLIFCSYCDEEYGGSHGALAGCMKTPAERVVNLDGKSLEIWNCAIGGGDITINYRINGAVDSAENTAKLLSIVMDEINKFGERRKQELRNNENYKDSILTEEALMYLEIRCGNDGNDLGDGHILFEYFTDKDESVIKKELDEVVSNINKRFEGKNAVCFPYEKATRHFHYGVSDKNCQAIIDMQKAAKKATGKNIKVVGSCLSDLSVILKYGSKDAFGFGVAGNFSEEGGAHQKNEFIDCDDLVEYTKILGLYTLDYLQ